MARNAATAREPQVDPNKKYVQVAVEAAIKNIEAAYELGLKSIKKHGESPHDKHPGIIPAFAADRGYRRDTVERARQFAHEFKLSAVKRLCRECRKRNYPLGVTLIYRALSLGDADASMRLLQRAIRGRWTLQRMAIEVHKRTGAMTRSGRPRALPNSPTEACQQVVSRFGPGVRWLKELKSNMDGQLGASLRSKIDKAVIALEALVDAAS